MLLLALCFWQHSSRSDILRSTGGHDEEMMNTHQRSACREGSFWMSCRYCFIVPLLLLLASVARSLGTTTIHQYLHERGATHMRKPSLVLDSTVGKQQEGIAYLCSTSVHGCTCACVCLCVCMFMHLCMRVSMRACTYMFSPPVSSLSTANGKLHSCHTHIPVMIVEANTTLMLAN